MDNIVKKVKKELAERFEAANFGDIEITMKCNGDKLRISPCGNKIEPVKSLSDVEYYLVESSVLPYLGSNTLEMLARNIVDYPKLVAEQQKNKLRLIEMFDDLNFEKSARSDADWSERFSSFSDFYKEVYGHRPHAVTRPIY